MHAEHLAALRTGPAHLFAAEEVLYAVLLDVLQVVHHAHPVLGPVTSIQTIQPVARKPVAFETVSGGARLSVLTTLDAAMDAGLCFAAVSAAATGAWIQVSCIGAAEAAVHPAGSDQRRADRISS